MSNQLSRTQRTYMVFIYKTKTNICPMLALGFSILLVAVTAVLITTFLPYWLIFAAAAVLLFLHLSWSLEYGLLGLQRYVSDGMHPYYRLQYIGGVHQDLAVVSCQIVKAK